MSVVLQALASGPIWGGVGVWIKSLETHFGWSRTQLTGASSLAQLEGSIIGPMIGYFIDRVGLAAHGHYWDAGDRRRIHHL